MRSNHRHAFTLVELLVVIGVIALLISVLLPALNKARNAAKSVACLSNLRQCAIGFFNYAADHKGYIALSRNKDSNITVWSWFMTAGYDCGDNPTGRIYIARKLAICPSAAMYEFEASRPNNNPGYYGYGLYFVNTGNSTLLFRKSDYQSVDQWTGGGFTWKLTSQKLIRLPASPSETVMLGDSRVGTPGAPQYGPGSPYTIGNFTDQGNGGYWQGRLFLAHGGAVNSAKVTASNPTGACKGRANVAFYDGHCESLSGGDLRTKTAQKFSVFWDRGWADVSLP